MVVVIGVCLSWLITAAVLTAEVGGRGSRGEKNGGEQERGT